MDKATQFEDVQLLCSNIHVGRVVYSHDNHLVSNAELFQHLPNLHCHCFPGLRSVDSFGPEDFLVKLALAAVMGGYNVVVLR